MLLLRLSVWVYVVGWSNMVKPMCVLMMNWKDKFTVTKIVSFMVWTTRLALNDIWPCSTFCGEDSSSAVLCCWSKTSSGPLLAPDRYCWSLLVTYYHPSLLLLGKISLGLQVSSESIQLVVADDSHVSSLLLLEIFSRGLRVSSVSIHWSFLTTPIPIIVAGGEDFARAPCYSSVSIQLVVADDPRCHLFLCCCFLVLLATLFDGGAEVAVCWYDPEWRCWNGCAGKLIQLKMNWTLWTL